MVAGGGGGGGLTGVAVGMLVVDLVLSSEGALVEVLEDQSVAHKWWGWLLCSCLFGY